MRIFPLFIAPLLALGILLASPAPGEELLVIVSPDTPVQTLSTKQLARIYKRKALLGPGGIPWRPLNLPADHPLRRAFSQELFQKFPEEMESYWNIQYFQGILPPYVVASAEAMVGFVAATPGTIGYVRRCKLSAAVKVVATLSIPLEPRPRCTP